MSVTGELCQLARSIVMGSRLQMKSWKSHPLYDPPRLLCVLRPLLEHARPANRSFTTHRHAHDLIIWRPLSCMPSLGRLSKRPWLAFCRTVIFNLTLFRSIPPLLSFSLLSGSSCLVSAHSVCRAYYLLLTTANFMWL